MHRAGLDAYERRSPERTGIYSFENRPRELSPEFEKSLLYYERKEKEETRLRRLKQLIESSEKGVRM